MHEPWTSVVAFFLVAAGLLAELSLLRMFISDGREGRRAEPRSGRQNRMTAARAESPRQFLTRKLAAALALAPIMMAGVARAQESSAPTATKASEQAVAPAVQPAPAADQAAKSPFSVQLNLDYTTAYYYHGIIQEDGGLILQPAAKLTINLYNQDDLKLDGFLGTWNSFHSARTASQTNDDFTDYWYESDLLGGIAITLGEWSLSTQYALYTSPSGAYETVQELDFTLAFDDSKPLGKFALHPYATLALETSADSSDGANSDRGTYLELGIGPGFSFETCKTPVTITFPVAVGLSLHDYYQNAAGEDDTFGFAQVGAKASVPLPFGERYGAWILTAGVSALFLGDHTAEYHNDRETQLIGTVGLQLSF